jgi:predicted metal-dependent hydrolase
VTEQGFLSDDVVVVVVVGLGPGYCSAVEKGRRLWKGMRMRTWNAEQLLRKRRRRGE